jgi:hypothetical protein
MQIMIGAMESRSERVAAILAELSDRRSIDVAALGSTVSEWISRLEDGHLPGLAWLTGMLDEAVRKAGLRFGADFMLFRKTILMVEGIVGDMTGESGLIDRVLLGEFAMRFFAELPWRFLMPPFSRSFATRISNMDVVELMAGFQWRALTKGF